jgi:hypothetical protein
MVSGARVIGLSLVTAATGFVLGFLLLGQTEVQPVASFVLGCTGAIVGTVAGAAYGRAAGVSPRFLRIDYNAAPLTSAYTSRIRLVIFSCRNCSVKRSRPV